VAEVTTRLEAAALLRDKAAWMEDRGKDPARETSMAKLLAEKSAWRRFPRPSR